MDHYKDLDDVRQAFVYFANRVPFYGVTVLCVDDENVRAILPKVTKRSILYGTRADAEIRCVGLELLPHGSRFRVEAAGRYLGAIELQVPGRHNALNALAAVAVGLELEIAFEHIVESLAGFHGVGRRFEQRGEVAGVRVVDDYGHHPTEIAATLAAAKGMGGRVLVIFPPIATRERSRSGRVRPLLRRRGPRLGDGRLRRRRDADPRRERRDRRGVGARTGDVACRLRADGRRGRRPRCARLAPATCC